jgi:hypothetical protein
MRRSVPAITVVAIVAAALLVAGCGGGSGGSSSSGPSPQGPHVGESGPEVGGGGKKATAPNAPAGSKVVACKEGSVDAVGLRATAVDCGTARGTMRRWSSSHACTLGKSSSRSSCSLGSFRCQTVRVDRGAAVSCARPGADVAWIAKAWLLRKGDSG